MLVPHLCNSKRSHQKCTALPDTNPRRVIVHFQSSPLCGKPGLQKSVNSNILRKSLIKKTRNFTGFLQTILEYSTIPTKFMTG